jgi:hypothetical protein
MANFFEDASFHNLHNSNLVNNGIIEGDVDQSDNSATAVGHGAVAGSGYSTVNAATGDGSVANQGSGTVNQASGHSQIISGSDVGQNAFGSPGSIQADGGAHGAFNTGYVQGVQADGPAIGNVVGHGNETATVLGNANGAGFGMGHSTVGVASGNTIHGDGAISGLGNSQNQSHIRADHGAAVGGHDAFGSNVQDQSTHITETNTTHIFDSEHVDSGEGHGYGEADHHYRPTHFDHVEAEQHHMGDDEHGHFFHG